MDLALNTYKGWYAIKPNQPTNQKLNNFLPGRSPCSVMANILDWDIVVSKFKLQSHHYVHFQSDSLSKSKVDDLSQGWPEGSIFNSYYTEV